MCFGQSDGTTSVSTDGPLFDASQHIQRSQGLASLPFDTNQVVDNLRYERYVEPAGWQARVQSSWVRDVYYRLRPMLPVALRKHLQRIYLRDWNNIQFPGWPLDLSVDLLLERLLLASMQASGADRLPFIWFWPEGHKACAIMTHDVETDVGRDFCPRLMDVDTEFGIPASFQIVPEVRYEVPAEYLQSIRDRGFEVNIHGLNHDGNLFRNRQTFLRQAEKINCYVEQFRALGFRSPIFYRNLDWFRYLNFSYDMSVPNVARLEPQRGGCCTVMPYSLPGGMTELPLTATEDYTLFHILKDYSTTLWKQQMSMVRRVHGLISFIIHPDYVSADREMDVYKQLLEEIGRLRAEEGVWVALPREVDRWWRDRNAMNLVADGKAWKIAGPGSDRARVAYACIDGDHLVYQIES
jgi:peptidoglycan/xylan/chitin deacetylase (PgdA/CDA1 family)